MSRPTDRLGAFLSNPRQMSLFPRLASPLASLRLARPHPRGGLAPPPRSPARTAMLSTAHGSLAPAAGARASPPRRRLVDARGGFSDSRRGHPSRRFALRATTNRVVSAANNDPSPSSPTTPPSFTRRLVERRYDTDAARALLLSLRARGVRSSDHLRAYLRDHAAPRFAGDAAQIAVVSLGAYASFLTRDALDLVLALDPAAGPFAPLARFGLGVLGFALACESIAHASKAAPVAFSHAAWYANAGGSSAAEAVARGATRRERRKRGLEPPPSPPSSRTSSRTTSCAPPREGRCRWGEEQRVMRRRRARARVAAARRRRSARGVDDAGSNASPAPVSSTPRACTPRSTPRLRGASRPRSRGSTTWALGRSARSACARGGMAGRRRRRRRDRAALARPRRDGDGESGSRTSSSGTRGSSRSSAARSAGACRCSGGARTARRSNSRAGKRRRRECLPREFCLDKKEDVIFGQ